MLQKIKDISFLTIAIIYIIVISLFCVFIFSIFVSCISFAISMLLIVFIEPGMHFIQYILFNTFNKNIIFPIICYVYSGFLLSLIGCTMLMYKEYRKKFINWIKYNINRG